MVNKSVFQLPIIRINYFDYVLVTASIPSFYEIPPLIV